MTNKEAKAHLSAYRAIALGDKSREMCDRAIRALEFENAVLSVFLGEMWAEEFQDRIDELINEYGLRGEE